MKRLGELAGNHQGDMKRYQGTRIPTPVANNETEDSILWLKATLWSNSSIGRTPLHDKGGYRFESCFDKDVWSISLKLARYITNTKDKHGPLAQ